MDYKRPVLAGAAVLLAAGLAAAPASAQPSSSGRITSVDQLHASIQHAVTLASSSGDTLGIDPAGFFPS
ncbi:MAG TPA: hypothetical protein VMB79_07165 [Jatrophihabitans sp.]|nr:hypothetical protein [Jatrophihabitans sp.]